MAKKQSKTETLDELNFEEALADLERIVADLETGQTGLDQTLARYERGVGLLRHCHDLLQKAERRIGLLRGVDGEGNPITAPLESHPSTRPDSSYGGDSVTPFGTRDEGSDMDSPEMLF
jgi:exodeoxyribonuclease VII small subunit